ncbi:MAG: ATP-binding cassette domain-containing protein [Thermodesulfobacteriota bacterium]
MDNVWQPEIDLQDITKDYGRLRALKGISLSVPKGTVFGLLGPNGAGKTTLVNILTTLIKPSSGWAKVCGLDVVKDAAKVRSLIGVVPQENNLDRYLTARENLILHAKMHGMKPTSYKRKIDELLSLMGLRERQHHFPNKFSVGMQRRLVVARALVHDPQVLFLDEPTTGLDPQAKRLIWDYFLSLKGQRTIFLTTHNMEEADFLCDQIFIIDHGVLIASGTSGQLKEMVQDNRYYEIEVYQQPEKYLQIIGQLSFVEKVTLQDGRIRVCLQKGGRLGSLVEKIDPSDLKKISAHQPSLEDVFLKLTGRSLRT